MPAAAAPALVTLALPPGPAFVEALDAAWERGDAVLPLDPAAPAAARARILDALRPDLPVEPGTALVLATSGSTGTPKGVVLDHAALGASADATLRRLGGDGSDHWLSCLPWHHIAGLQVLLRARRSGAGLTVHEKFDVDRVRGESAATVVSLVPTQLARLLDASVDLRRFRAILLGGAPPSPALLERATAAGAPVVVTYGMTETCGGCVYDGAPLDGVDVRVDDSGRIWLRGPMLMQGYRLDRQRTAAALVDGWFRTGDVGAVEDGRLVVHGRADDVIISGGVNVAATAVEAVLAAEPAVAEAAVVGVPDPEWGERVAAVITARTEGAVAPGDGDGREDRAGLVRRLEALVRAELGAAAVPKSWLFVDELPRLSSGKPDRLAVRALALDQTVAAEK